MTPAPRRAAAFTLLELGVSLAIVIALAGISIPVYSRVTQGARAAACMGNLRQLGVALNLYVGEHNQTIPIMEGGRSDRGEQKPAIDNTLDAYTQNKDVFRCPADNEGLFARTGTSYFWNVALNGQNLSNLNFFGRREWTYIPLLSDKDPFHLYTDTKVNILYADDHADKELRFGSPPPK